MPTMTEIRVYVTEEVVHEVLQTVEGHLIGMVSDVLRNDSSNPEPNDLRDSVLQLVEGAVIGTLQESRFCTSISAIAQWSAQST